LIVLVLLRVSLPGHPLWGVRLLPPVTPLSHLSGPSLLPSVELSYPKSINIKQYLSTDNFSVNNRHVAIKSSQTTQLYTAKVIYKHLKLRQTNIKPFK
jgi:hypothetical protein